MAALREAQDGGLNGVGLFGVFMFRTRRKGNRSRKPHLYARRQGDGEEASIVDLLFFSLSFCHESMNIRPNLFDGTQSLGKIVYLYSDFFHLLVKRG